MRKIGLLLLLLFCLHTNAADEDSLIIRFFSWNPDSPCGATCLSFENAEISYSEYIVTSPVEIDSLSGQLHKLQKCRDKNFQVGCKLYFTKSGKVNRVYCMDNNYVFSQNLFYKNNKDVINRIDRLMAIYPEVKNDDRFFPKELGDEFPQGRDSLFRILHKNMAETIKKLNYNDTLIVTVYCRADINGKTKSVKINPVSKKLLSTKEKKIIRRLKNILMTKITWSRNLERRNGDFIIFPYIIKRVYIGSFS